MRRRLFLRPEQFARTAGALLGPAAVAVSPPPPAPGGYTLVRVSRRAMATTFEIALPYGTPDAVPAAEDALDLIDAIEDRLTVYRDHSEVSGVNARAADGPVPVSAELFDLLAFCLGVTRETDGAFDAATGSLIKAWGFYRREGRVPTATERADAMANAGSRHVVLDTARRTVRFRRPGLELNFGAVGKGYALDRAAALLRERWGVRSALLHGGGSSVVAIGHPPGDPRGWAVALKHPWADGESLGAVRLRDRALGVSAATFQYFEYNGRKLGHLIDPRLGWPADGTAAAAVTAPTGAEADALSTALFVLGGPAADRLTRTRPHLGAVVLPETPADAGPRAFNFGPDEYVPPSDPVAAVAAPTVATLED